MYRNGRNGHELLGANGTAAAFVPDVYPLPGTPLAVTPGLYQRGDAGFSRSAFASLLLLGLGVRVLVYLSLLCKDRGHRR